MTMETCTAELVLDLRADLAEGPVWDEAAHRLRLVDITAMRIHTHDPANGSVTSTATRAMVGCIAPTASGKLAGLGRAVRLPPGGTRAAGRAVSRVSLGSAARAAAGQRVTLTSPAAWRIISTFVAGRTPSHRPLWPRKPAAERPEAEKTKGAIMIERRKRPA